MTSCVASGATPNTVRIKINNETAVRLVLDRTLVCDCAKKHLGFKAVDGKFPSDYPPPTEIAPFSEVTLRCSGREGSGIAPKVRLRYVAQPPADLEQFAEAYGFQVSGPTVDVTVNARGWTNIFQFRGKGVSTRVKAYPKSCQVTAKDMVTKESKWERNIVISGTVHWRYELFAAERLLELPELPQQVASLNAVLTRALLERAYWETSGSDPSNRLVPIDLDSHEAMVYLTHFRESGCADVEVVSMARIENGHCLRRFAFHKLALAAKYGCAVDERVVFHGTKASVVDKIAEQGFDMRLSGSNVGCWHGKGSYFSRSSEYSSKNMYSAPDANGVRHMFIARILLGEVMEAETRTDPDDQIPRPELDNGTVVDTAVDNLDNPQTYVTFDNGQSMPLYVIGFRSA